MNKIRNKTLLILLISFFVCCNNTLSASPIKKEIDQGWKFRQGRLNNWYPATVPGVIHTDLMANLTYFPEKQLK